MIRLRRPQRGDTILEVMICVAIIGLILAAAFGLASRNGTAQLQAQERGEALKFAETQLELLKSYADINKLPNKNLYFCVKTDPASSTGVSIVELNGPATPQPNKEFDQATNYPNDCKDPGGLFKVAIWSPNKVSQIGGTSGVPYGVTVRWDAAGGNGIEELKTFYNLYDTADPAFSVIGDPPAVCSNGIDDDGDGLTDFPDDKGCTSASYNQETNPQCSNSIDDDGNGKIDFAGGDLGCANSNDNSESPDPVAPPPPPPPPPPPVPVCTPPDFLYEGQCNSI